MKKVVVGLVAGALSVGASYATQDMYIGAYGGSTEKILKEEVFPMFEQANDVKIHYLAGNSTTTLARLLAKKSNPDLDVVFIDDGPMSQAVQMGMCERIQGFEKYPVHDFARFAKDRAIGLGVIATGLVYNKQYFAQQGWDAPDSWKDLLDPKYKDKMTIPPISNGYGLLALVELNALHGGNQRTLDKGFDLFKNQINAIVNHYEPSSGKLSEQFQSGEVALAVWGSSRAYGLKSTGFPVEFVYPKEGAIALRTALCAVIKSDVPELSQKFIKFMLSEKVQTFLAKEKQWGPVNKEIVLPDAIRAQVPSGMNAANLKSYDWGVINKYREQWTKRWNREVE